MQTHTKVRRKILLLQAFVVAILVLMVFFAMGLSFFFLNLSESYGNQGFFVASLLPLLYCAVSFYIFFSYTAPKPKGITINKNSAPDLIEYIENVINHCGGNAKFGSINLTTGSSIYVYYEPSLANFLRPKPPTLVIGDSLMRFLSTEEFGAVLSHEIAHLEQPQTYYKAYLAKISNQSAKLAATGNSGFSRVSFMSIYGWPTKILEKLFASVYKSVFNSNKKEYLELERQMEIEADAISANKYGAGNLLRALAKSCLLNERKKVFRGFIYPYLKLQGKCSDYWKTFCLCNRFFMKHDGVSISMDGYLEIQDEALFMMSLDRESPLTIARINTLAEQNNTDDEVYTGANCLIPEHLEILIDKTLYCGDKDKQSCILNDADIEEILASLNSGVFNEAQTLEDVKTIISEIQVEITSTAVAAPIVMPEYAAPSCDVVPSPFTASPSDMLFTSDELHCPVCGKEIEQYVKICPHCHEVIAE